MFCSEEQGRHQGDRSVGEQSGDNNGRSPRERREEALREDEKLKREVDEALREWDRLLEGDRSAGSTESTP
jgi:hypothetical protein